MRWIIGDIHGMLRPLSALIEGVALADSGASFIFVGDYVNRGPDSRGVIELLRSLPNAQFVRGNHDDIFDYVLHGTCVAPELLGPNRLAAFHWFCHHGLAETLLSYGAEPGTIANALTHPTESSLDSLCQSVPPPHRAFIHALPLAVEFPDFFVAHALWPPDEPTDNPGIAQRAAATPRRREGILWGRFTKQDIDAPKVWQRLGYFGHTPVDAYHDHWRPVIGDNMVLLDTAAALSANGRLTAWCHESRQYIQADRNGQIKTGIGTKTAP
ncbi:MAG TPA: metallophosphoesterase [Tepidisphaeraceae bacterium]|nr:metallophosphoesterase [Tepidisphaeraceae bacterium]